MLSKFFHRNSMDFGVPIFFCEFLFAEPPLWIILSFELSINHNNYEAHDFGTMGLCELYWISICLCEHRGKLRLSKQHRFGLIFWVFFVFLLFVFVFAFCFCLFLFVFLIWLLISSFCACFDLKQKQRHPPLPKKIYIQTPDRPPLAAVNW